MSDSTTIDFADRRVCFDHDFPFWDHVHHAVFRKNEKAAVAREAGSDALVEHLVGLERRGQGDFHRTSIGDDNHAEDDHHRRVRDQ